MDIRELHKYQIKKKQTKITTYEKIVSRCFHRIKVFAKLDQTYCFFEVPNIIFGLPIYDLTNCIHFLMQRLVDHNFKVLFIKPNIIFITWDIRLTKSSAPKKISNQQKKIDKYLQNINSNNTNTYHKKFKEITSYKPTKKIIYDESSVVDFNNKANQLLFNKKNDFFNT